jgi:hypothetical protein
MIFHPHIPTCPPIYSPTYLPLHLPTYWPLSRYIQKPTYMAGPTCLISIPMHPTLAKNNGEKNENIVWNLDSFTQTKV